MGKCDSVELLGVAGVTVMGGAPILAGFSSWNPSRFSQGRLEKAPPCGAGWGRETAGTTKSFPLIFHTEQKAKSSWEREPSKLVA